MGHSTPSILILSFLCLFSRCMCLDIPAETFPMWRTFFSVTVNTTGCFPWPRHSGQWLTCIDSFNPLRLLWDKHHWPHFTDKEMEAQELKPLSKTVCLLCVKAGTGMKIYRTPEAMFFLLKFLLKCIVDLHCCVPGAQQSYSVIFFCRFFSIIGYYKILSLVPCMMQ